MRWVPQCHGCDDAEQLRDTLARDPFFAPRPHRSGGVTKPLRVLLSMHAQGLNRAEDISVLNSDLAPVSLGLSQLEGNPCMGVLHGGTQGLDPQRACACLSLGGYSPICRWFLSQCSISTVTGPLRTCGPSSHLAKPCSAAQSLTLP